MVDNFVRSLGYSAPSVVHRAYVEVWRQWYSGEVSDFHNYTIYNGGVTTARKRATLRIAKQICEYWACLLWNDDTYITLENPADDVKLHDVLLKNEFYPRFTALIEIAFALGTGAVTVCERGGEVAIDFLPVESIHQIGDFETAFVGKFGGNDFLQIHERGRVRNFLLDAEGKSKTLPENVASEYEPRETRYALIKPAIVNNLFNSRLGISIYANAIEIMKCVDLAFDGVKTSMEIGRPRVGVSNPMLKPVAVNGGTELRNVFDANDIAVYDLGLSDEGKVAVQDLTTEYRADKFELSLHTQLKLLSQAVGLGNNAFRWDSTGFRTITEVIADNSSMLRAMEKHQSALNVAVQTIVRAILDVLGLDTKQTITIKFDDSATRDRGAERERFWGYVAAGEFPMWKFLVDFEGYSVKEAKEIANDPGQD